MTEEIVRQEALPGKLANERRELDRIRAGLFTIFLILRSDDHEEGVKDLAMLLHEKAAYMERRLEDCEYSARETHKERGACDR